MTKKEKKNGIEVSVHVAKGDVRNTFLGNYLKNTDQSGSNIEKDVWFDVGFTFEDGVKPEDAVEFVTAQKDLVLTLAGQAIPGFQESLDQFVTFEVIKGLENKNVVTLRVKGQASVGQMVENLLGHAYQLIEHLPNNQQFLFRVKSKYTFEEIFNNNFSLYQALKGFEAEIRVELIRDYLKKICHELKDKHLSNIVSILTAPTNLQLSIKMEVDNLIPTQIKEQTNIPCLIAKQMLGGIVNSVLGEGSIVHKVQTVNLTLNGYEIYAHVKLHVPGLLK